MACVHWSVGRVVCSLVLVSLCACSPIQTSRQEAVKNSDEITTNISQEFEIPVVEILERNDDGVITSWSLSPASSYLAASDAFPGLSFDLVYEDQDEDGYMESVHLIIALPNSAYVIILRDENHDNSPDFVVFAKTRPGIYTTDLDGDGRFDLFSDSEADKVRIPVEGVFVEVDSVEGIGEFGTSSSGDITASSAEGDATYIFANGIWSIQN